MTINIDNNRKSQLEKLRERDSMIRGAYLTNVSIMASYILDIISYHFCSPGLEVRRRQFISLFLNEHVIQNPDSITNLLEKIVVNDYTDLLKKYPSLFEDLRRINDYTLWLYSSVLDTSLTTLNDEKLQDTIRLVYYDQKGGMCHVDLTKEEIEERLSDCFNVRFALEDLRSEIRDLVLTDRK